MENDNQGNDYALKNFQSSHYPVFKSGGGIVISCCNSLRSRSNNSRRHLSHV
jgi:hypothetical protein